ncbi:Ribulose bisphosphate carboxylase/oxygenase activase [Planktothrix rubescens]|nr:Ribulose bisphosphate carboxylase/oxygenase activase [Planktothrix rubescens]
MSYYVSPRFLDKLAVHITKNFLQLPGVRVPLILGIHGRKGEGKTFQCELVFEKMGFEPVMISGGELESPDAGDPARLIRLRYREASEQVKVRGQMCALFINDLDAGAGRFDSGTQYTVNTQLVNATLMNIADNPTNVQLPGSYDATPLNRIPIIVTGNDFSTLYAPLIRDGRMEKFYWEPTREERIGVLSGIFPTAELSQQDITQLVDTFPEQSIDFFSAVRSRIYDEQIRDFIHKLGVEKISKRIVNSAEKPPEFQNPNFKLPHLIEMGKLMVGEQKRIKDMRLVEEYNQFRTFNSQFGVPSTQVNSENPINLQNKIEPNSDGKKLPIEVLEQIDYILSSSYRIGLEYADKRRFKTGSWNSCGLNSNESKPNIIQGIETCLTEHPQDYIRLLGIDPIVKRRVIEMIIQKPE